jgi:hypothetical protein
MQVVKSRARECSLIFFKVLGGWCLPLVLVGLFSPESWSLLPINNDVLLEPGPSFEWYHGHSPTVRQRSFHEGTLYYSSLCDVPKSMILPPSGIWPTIWPIMYKVQKHLVVVSCPTLIVHGSAYQHNGRVSKHSYVYTHKYACIFVSLVTCVTPLVQL